MKKDERTNNEQDVNNLAERGIVYCILSICEILNFIALIDVTFKMYEKDRYIVKDNNKKKK